MNPQLAREQLGRKLGDVSEVALGVFRGLRRSGVRDIAAHVFDLNNRLPETVGSLSDYLDEVIGPSYFNKDASPDLRWNSYLYFVVDADYASNPSFKTIKRNLEADTSYARKFVVVESELERVLGELDSVASVDGTVAATDVVQSWSEALGASGLSDVLDVDRPVADVVRVISLGTTKQSVRTKKSTGVESSQRLVESHLKSIDLTEFRSFPKECKFDGLGKVNLLFGANGVGKTSFLEGLEFLYCGANRRSDAAASAIVQGLLTSGQTVKTSGMQLLTDFKTRQRLWYGGDDNTQQNKLPNQFARFNFLNTDAAAELTLGAEDSKSSSESLAALLSGHEATLMWKRIQDVRKAVSDEARSKRSERAVAESELNSKEQERKALEAAPGQADAAFTILVKSLERIQWRNAPRSKQEVSMLLADDLADLASRLSIIPQLNWMDGPVTSAKVFSQVSSLQIAENEVKTAFSEAQEIERQREALLTLQGYSKTRLAELTALPQNTLAEITRYSLILERVDAELAAISQSIAALPTVDSPTDWEMSWGGMTIPEAASISQASLIETSTELDVKKQRYALLSRTHTELQSAMIELHAWAQKAIEHRHSDSNCPVCGTEFPAGELFARMKSLALAPSDNAVSELRLSIEQLSARLSHLSIVNKWLLQLDMFGRAISGGVNEITVEEALKRATNLRERQRFLHNEQNTAHQALSAYEQAGFTQAKVKMLFAPIDGADKLGSLPQDVLEARSQVEKFVREINSDIDKGAARIQQLRQEISAQLLKVGISAEKSLNGGIELMSARLRTARDVEEICSTVSRFLEITPATDLHLLATSLTASVLDAKKVQASLEVDANATHKLSILNSQLSQLTERLGRTRNSIDSLTRALRVLDELIEKQSLDKATATVVAATYKVADEIFKRIHVPAEYMVTSDANIPLRRRENNAAVQLSQVSTGQRAAYALSMFLAMNAQVKNGPKSILLDDPISHVDDLNALSFLDYLRNLVLKSDRQLFFATADEKVAGLFAHKFGFLDSDFKTFELTRS